MKHANFLHRASTYKLAAHVVSDIIAFNAGVTAAYFSSSIVKSVVNPDYPHPSLPSALDSFPVMFLVPLFILLFESNKRGHYTRFKGLWEEFGEVIRIVLTVAGLTIALLYILRIEFSRTWLLTSWALILLLVPIARIITKRFLRRVNRWFTPTLVIGSGKNALDAALAIESDPNLGFKVQALVDMNLLSGNDGAGTEQIKQVKAFDQIHRTYKTFDVLGSRDDFDRHAKSENIPYIVFALESGEFTEYQKLVDDLMLSRHTLSVIPPIKGMPLMAAQISPIFRHEVLHIKITTNLANWSSRQIKRVLDVSLSSLLILALMPLGIIVALLIKRDGGAVFFSQERVGMDGKLFNCWKFRSMEPDASSALQLLLKTESTTNTEYKLNCKLKADPRVTPTGKFIRKYSIDELPQLYNVLIGEMSLVGPRPVQPDELEAKYGKHAQFYLATPPGITGLWQVSGRNNLDYETRISLDTWYVRNWTLWGDIQIFARTITAVLKADGAY